MALTSANLDFTVQKYRTLCEALATSRYIPFTFRKYLSEGFMPELFVIMRHDIDRKPENALNIANIEQEFGIKATYYFRCTKTVFNPRLIGALAAMGHESGYHYEVLSAAHGDYEKAIQLFRQELNILRTTSDIRTIAMYGSPVSQYDNGTLWNVYDFRTSDVIGEAYPSVGSDVHYSSDTGRSWSWKDKTRDFIQGHVSNVVVDTTDELIEVLQTEKVPNAHILTHPERWTSNGIEWGANYIQNFVFNRTKRVLRALGSELPRYSPGSSARTAVVHS